MVQCQADRLISIATSDTYHILERYAQRHDKESCFILSRTIQQQTRCRFYDVLGDLSTLGIQDPDQLIKLAERATTGRQLFQEDSGKSVEVQDKELINGYMQTMQAAYDDKDSWMTQEQRRSFQQLIKQV